MEESERQKVVDQFIASEKHLLGLVEGLSPAQWGFQTAPDRWSIAQIVEHVMAVEARITGAMKKMTAQAPAEGVRSAVPDERLWKGVPDRTTKLQAPPPVHPAGKFAETSEMLKEFQALRARTIELALTTEARLRHYLIPHMAFGEIDLYQWLIVLSLHGTRHAGQIAEIKADPGFPK